MSSDSESAHVMPKRKKNAAKRSGRCSPRPCEKSKLSTAIPLSESDLRSIASDGRVIATAGAHICRWVLSSGSPRKPELAFNQESRHRSSERPSITARYRAEGGLETTPMFERTFPDPTGGSLLQQ